MFTYICKHQINRFITLKKLLVALLFFFAVLNVSAQKAKKVVFMIVDGISSDALEKIKKPHLDSIAHVGGYVRAYVGGERKSYSQTPTISAVGYNSLLTGTWVNKHNVWGNDIKAPNYNYWTIFRFLKEQYPQKKTAIFSTWLDNRTKLIGEGLPQTGKIQTDYHFDGLELDTLRYPHDKLSEYIHHIDEKVTTAAAASIKKDAPDLTWVYLEYTDDMGHKFGDSPQFEKAIELMDKQVGRIWQAIQYRQKHFNEDWVIYITTDHGRDAQKGMNHGGQSDRERATWIVTSAQHLNPYFRQYQPGIVDIMPSIASFLSISIPKEQLFEIDGVPLTGKISAILPEARYQNGNIEIAWKAIDPKGKANIWVATTNNFETGKKDNYQLMKQVPVGAQKASINVSRLPSSFYKVVIELPHNVLNRWVILEK